MATAYLKISVEAGMEKHVQKAVQAIPEVVSADLTTGDQDIIAIAEAPTYELLLKIIIDKMRGIKGISSTSTSLVLE